jgi:hypothetical protein
MVESRKDRRWADVFPFMLQSRGCATLRAGVRVPSAKTGTPRAIVRIESIVSSKDLLEACVVFAMALTFVVAFRLKK